MFMVDAEKLSLCIVKMMCEMLGTESSSSLYSGCPCNENVAIHEIALGGNKSHFLRAFFMQSDF